jgi:hypothetical protein
VVDIIWDGITKSYTLNEKAVQLRQELANASKQYDWSSMLKLVEAKPELVNTVRPDGVSWYMPLHQAAHGNAPVEVVEKLLELGAFRTILTAKNERPVDIAERQGHSQILSVLAPVFRHKVPKELLQQVEDNFHAVIRGRVENLIEEHQLRLPQLEPLLELERSEMWFAVPGMYGGFSYKFERFGDDPLLISSSWCRVVGGSGQRHEVTCNNCRLVEEGFA